MSGKVRKGQEWSVKVSKGQERSGKVRKGQKMSGKVRKLRVKNNFFLLTALYYIPIQNELI
jgi:transcription termination factor Rho